MARLPTDPATPELLDRPPRSRRPTIMGTRHSVVSTQYLASQAAFQMLETGGNAVDAGVAAGIALGILEPSYVSIAGVAPIMVYLADRREVVTISGLGTWPKAASCEFFQKRYGGALPMGLHISVVPAAPDAWITALELYGTRSFGEVAAAAIRLAWDGFPMSHHLSNQLKGDAAAHRAWPSNAAIYLPNGRSPEPGEMFVQKDQARVLRYMTDEEAVAAKRGRRAGLAAARNAFYRGDIARTITTFYRQNDGLLTDEDLANFRVAIEPPVRARFRDVDVYACGPWCQGPMLLQTLNLLDSARLREMGHNSLAYIHTVTEAIKLAAADREAYYGDPRFVDVPMEALLSREYSTRRRDSIHPDRASPGMPPPGVVTGSAWRSESDAPPGRSSSMEADEAARARERVSDTSYVCAVDRYGNAFSATPSDMCADAPVVPGTGFVVSPRGSQSWTDPAHPSCVAPGKRPRLTPNPALAIREGEFVMPFGTPGGDTQTQTMLQVFLNLVVFGMDPQVAVEEARFLSYSFPGSFEPHIYRPGELRLEKPIAAEIGHKLAAMGHKVDWWPEWWNQYGTSVCVIVDDKTTGVMQSAADPRRTGYVAAL